MSPRPAPLRLRDAVRLLVVNELIDGRMSDLRSFLEPGDLLILNDAATIPASLSGETEAGAPVELRLAGDTEHGFLAALFGDGDWRTPTEHRSPPPPLAPGDLIRIGDEAARVRSVSSISPRLVEVEGLSWSGIYAWGRPIQYAHLATDLPLDAVQNGYAVRPRAFEMPSAGRPLTASVLAALRRRGVRIATITHAAGISSTGDPTLDGALPLPERYEIPEATVEVIAKARRVIAAGTSVVRALEGCHAAHGRLVAGEGRTDLILDAGFEPRVVDAVLTGLHVPTESHYRLLLAFAPDAVLRRAVQHAEEAGYHNHELGDLMLTFRSNERRLDYRLYLRGRETCEASTSS